jgi:hypothetical protein
VAGAAVALLAAAALFGCGGSSSTETSTGKFYTVGTKLGERGPSPFDPTELSGPLSEELEHYLIANYEGESWFPSLEDVWDDAGAVLVSTSLDGSAKSTKAAEEVCIVVRNAKVKHHARKIMVEHGFNELFEC